ncbi:hypothetical protein SAMN04487967_0664 [Natronorubrum sediminis]|uniref:Uncharacterized protein n=1 Tax=Natronorubrum sediminis TaxID=640943 RepID=A0A1H6FQJ3_9EURY|nr:hypothetical protein SAMN04487967_0664 [Natronorubrum sediminis]
MTSQFLGCGRGVGYAGVDVPRRPVSRQQPTVCPPERLQPYEWLMMVTRVRSTERDVAAIEWGGWGLDGLANREDERRVSIGGVCR